MNTCPANFANAAATARPTSAWSAKHFPLSHWPLLLAAAAIPLSLLWDFSWESTVGVDLFWSPPHTATYLAVAFAGLTALSLVLRTTRTASKRADGIRVGGLYAPLGVWLTLWGTLAFLGAVLFDRWWQSAYGLGAGIWHPPQITKAVAFFAVLAGAWLLCLNHQNQYDGNSQAGVMGFAIGGGLVMVMITVVTMISTYPNRQHSAWFYKLACATYPIVLTALAAAGRLRFPATIGAAAYTLVLGGMVWLLPLFHATPQIGPIYNRLDHFMPPPFPLLLIPPAFIVDLLLRNSSWRPHRWQPWLQTAMVGIALSMFLIPTQWFFAEFLLTDSADNWFFAGGGTHWPFFLKIAPAARQAFWSNSQETLNWPNSLAAVVLAMAAVRVGLWVGAWMKQLKR